MTISRISPIINSVGTKNLFLANPFVSSHARCEVCVACALPLCADSTAIVYKGYREFTGIICTLYRVFPVTGKTFNISRKPLESLAAFNVTGIPC